MKKWEIDKTELVLGILVFVLACTLGYGLYKYRSLGALFNVAKSELASSTLRVLSLEKDLSDKESEVSSLSEALKAEVERNDNFEDQIREISGSVGVLKKLQQTDPELLQKYSKVYFLNENYIPASISLIPEKFMFGVEKAISFHSDGLPFLKDLLEDAEEDGVDLKVASGYRSFDAQTALKSNYRVTYGSGANQFSADQGYSEHQLGTTVDFLKPSQGGLITAFDQTEEFKWLQENAHEYGFVLSYPKGNSYYQYEPWHWRFVGKDLAAYLRKENMHFYDLDQRAIDAYLVTIFDK